MRKKVMIYSQGIGPVNRSLNRFLVKHILNKVDCITVRDEKSKLELEEMGVKIPSIQITADPVIGLDPVDTKVGKKILEQDGLSEVGQKPIVGFAVRGWKKDEKLKTMLAKTADRLIEDLKMDVVFIPFHYGEDLKMMEEIEAEMKNPAVFIKNKYELHEMLSITGSLDLLVGIRLHSLIFAAIMNVPMIAISYDPKINSFMDSLGLKTLSSVEDLEYEDLLIEIQSKGHYVEKEKAILRERVKDLKQKLSKNEKLVNELITQGVKQHEK